MYIICICDRILYIYIVYADYIVYFIICINLCCICHIMYECVCRGVWEGRSVCIYEFQNRVLWLNGAYILYISIQISYTTCNYATFTIGPIGMRSEKRRGGENREISTEAF